MVPPPCSYSRRICSYSSTLALLLSKTVSPSRARKPETIYTIYVLQVGPNQSIERGQFRVSKSRIASNAPGQSAMPTPQVLPGHYRLAPHVADLSEFGGQDQAQRHQPTLGSGHHLHSPASRIRLSGGDFGRLFQTCGGLGTEPHAGSRAYCLGLANGH